MRIVIFGASSRAGLYIVKEALEKEHRVAAFTRRPEAFPLGHPKLEVIGGDILDEAAVSRALSGARGVISALTCAAIRSPAAENIVRGMEAAHCPRVVWLSPAGKAKRYAWSTPVRRLLGLLVRRSPRVEDDAIVRLRESDVDWVLIKTPGRFREGRGPNPVRVLGDVPAAGKFIYLADLAEFIVEELEKGRYRKMQPAVFSA